MIMIKANISSFNNFLTYLHFTVLLVVNLPPRQWLQRQDYRKCLGRVDGAELRVLIEKIIDTEDASKEHYEGS